MPKAVDKHPQSRGVGNALFNPTRSGVSSYEDPMSAISNDMQAIGANIGDFFSALGSIFGLPTPAQVVLGVANGIESVIAGATGFISGVGQFFGRLVGGFIDGAQIPILDPSKIFNLPNLFTNFQNTLNGIVRGWTRVPDAIGSPEDVEVIFGATRQVQFGLITLADLNAAPKNVPLWVSPNPFDDVTFPRDRLQPVTQYSAGQTATMSSSGTTVTASGNNFTSTQAGQLNSHRHNFTVDATIAKPLFTIPAGTLALTSSRLLQAGIKNLVRFMASGDTPGGQLLLGLYALDVVTGKRTRVYNFGNIASQVDTGPKMYEVAVTMTEDMLTEQGSIYEVGILPLGASFSVAAVPRIEIVPDPIIYPQGSTELLASQTGLPAEIVETALDHSASHRIWAAIGQALPETITPITLITDFDAYADNGNWSSPVFKYFSNRSDARIGITAGKAYATGPVAITPIDYVKSALYLQRCATDDMFSEIVIGSTWSGENFGSGNRAYVRCNAEGTQGACLQVDQRGNGLATVQIVSITNMLGGGTPRATSTGTFQALPGDTFRIEARGGHDGIPSTYVCLRNGDPLDGAAWTDTGLVVPVGTAWRRGAFSEEAATYSNQIHRKASIDLHRCGDLAA